MNYIEGVILMQKKAVAFTGHRPESLPFGRDMHSGKYDDFELMRICSGSFVSISGSSSLSAGCPWTSGTSAAV